MNLADTYLDTQRRLVALAPTLSDEQLDVMTPTCPEWRVRDIYAHLAGLAVDLASEEVERPGASVRTAVHVAERRGRVVQAICNEWTAVGPAVAARIEREGRRMTAPVVDVWTHEQDIANAAGVESGRGAPGLAVATGASWVMKRKLRDAGIPPVRIIAGEEIDWVIGDDPPAATLRLSVYELARAAMGRRSFDQIRAFDWQGDPEPYLEHFAVFTPPPYDIVE